MPKIYKVKYNEKYREMFQDNSEYWTFEPSYTYHKTIESRDVPVKLEFKLSYMGESDYTYWDKAANETKTVHILTQRQEYGPTWNYTPEEFEKQYNGKLNILYGYPCDEIVPEEVYQVYLLLNPNAKRGYYDHDARTWKTI